MAFFRLYDTVSGMVPSKRFPTRLWKPQLHIYGTCGMRWIRGAKPIQFGWMSPADASFYRPYFSFIPLAQGCTKNGVQEARGVQRLSPLGSECWSRSAKEHRRIARCSLFYIARTAYFEYCGRTARWFLAKSYCTSRVPECGQRGFPCPSVEWRWNRERFSLVSMMINWYDKSTSPYAFL